MDVVDPTLIKNVGLLLLFGGSVVLALKAGENVSEGKKAEAAGDESVTPAFGHAIGRRAILRGYLQAWAAIILVCLGLLLSMY